MKLLTNRSSQGSPRRSLIDDAKIFWNRKRAVNILSVQLSAWTTTMPLDVFEAANNSSQDPRRRSLIENAKICYNRKRAVNILIVNLSAWIIRISVDEFEAMNFS